MTRQQLSRIKRRPNIADIPDLVAEIEKLDDLISQLSERVFERIDWLREKMAAQNPKEVTDEQS